MPAKLQYRRSYNIKVSSATNKGKLAQLDAMQVEWVKLMSLTGELLFSEFRSGLREKPLQMRNASIASIKESPLQNSIKQCACVAAEGVMSSWKSNLANRLSKLIMRSHRYSEEFKHELNSALRIAGLKDWAKIIIDRLKRLPANRLDSSTLGSAREGLKALSKDINMNGDKLLEVSELKELATLLNCIKKKEHYSIYLNNIPTSECK